MSEKPSWILDKQDRQDCYDFLVQLKTYKNYQNPITMTLETMAANLSYKVAYRIERAVMKRLAEVSPGVFGKETFEATGREFGGIDTAPNDPTHVRQVIDHIAHLEDHQVAEIQREICNWDTDE